MEVSWNIHDAHLLTSYIAKYLCNPSGTRWLCAICTKHDSILSLYSKLISGINKCIKVEWSSWTSSHSLALCRAKSRGKFACQRLPVKDDVPRYR